jgi:hypothetical protein
MPAFYTFREIRTWLEHYRITEARDFDKPMTFIERIVAMGKHSVQVWLTGGSKSIVQLAILPMPHVIGQSASEHHQHSTIPIILNMLNSFSVSPTVLDCFPSFCLCTSTEYGSELTRSASPSTTSYLSQSTSKSITTHTLQSLPTTSFQPQVP